VRPNQRADARAHRPQVRAAAADTLDTVSHLIPVFLNDIAQVSA
jgi:hypothetical protein